MCGIAGLHQLRRGALEAFEIVQRMTSTMIHRGPDASGTWSDPAGRCILGHRRLSIIDTSNAGRQPMASGDGRWLITFNGEIYNFQSLRPALTSAGVQLRGRTDTEVLVEAIAMWGTEAFSKFDGMFALGAFDTLTGELILARDAFGEKPLYYLDLPDQRFAFASELHALECVPGFDGIVDINAIAEVLSFQYIGAPRSIYRSVKKLPPGSWLRRDASGKITIGRYFRFRPGASGFTDRPMNDLVDELEDILVRSLQGRLISDVPLGAFLSGGVDSSVACALIRRKLNRPLMTFSTGFEGASESEHLTTRIFAEHLGTDHHENVLTPNAADFLLNIGSLLDEPNGDSSCLPTYLLSRFARQKVTVAISGDGGDEMFGGYGRYFVTLDEYSRHAAGEIPAWAPGAAYFGSRILISNERHIEELLDFVPLEFSENVRTLRQELDETKHLLCEMRRSDAENYMPGAVLAKVDRMSMQHSLEVRTPYLNAELARFAERLPDSVLVQDGRGKIILRELAYRYLPRELIDLPKQGFGLPMSDWARTSLLNVAAKMLDREESRLAATLGPEAIQRFMTRQRTPGQFAPYQIWSVVMLESWFRHHPAILPSLAPTRQHSISSAYKSLDVAPIGRRTFLVGNDAANVAQRPDIEAIVQQAIAALNLPHVESNNAREYREPHVSRQNDASLTLPSWGQPLTPGSRGRDLQGSTLLFYERDASLNFDHGEMGKFRALGVKRLIYRSPWFDREFHEIEIRHFSRLEWLANVVRLFRYRIGIISNNVWMRALGARAFCTSTVGYHQSDVFNQIDLLPDTELSSSYFVFEGFRQLPPVHVPHIDIGTRGNGRYSIWNQIAIFSPTEKSRLARRPYWIVPRTTDTERLLRFVPRTFQIPALGHKHLEKLLRDMLEDIVAHERGQLFSLAPGDPIVVCTHGLPPGGAERQWIYLSQALSEAGYRVTFVTYEPLENQNGHYLPILKKSGIPVLDLSKMSILEANSRWPKVRGASGILASHLVPESDRLIKLTAAFAAIAPKVVFSQLDHPNILAALAAHFARIPRVVMSFRSYNPSNLPHLMNDWFLPAYRLLAKSDRVLFSGNNRRANDDYAQWIGIPPERIAFVPNAIERDMFPIPSDADLSQLRRELGLNIDTPVILGVFRLSREKDPVTFVETCARVADAIPNLRVYVVGIGPMESQLEARIGQLGLRETVRLLGRRSDINVLMRIAHLVMLTSAVEGMPNVLMEAQLMGAPIVATRAGGGAGHSHSRADGFAL